MINMVIQLTPPEGKRFHGLRHTREGGYPEVLKKLDSRLHGNDKQDIPASCVDSKLIEWSELNNHIVE